MRLPSDSAADLLVLDDSELAERIARHDHAAFETLMRRHNGRLFRVARAILRDDAEAEDALQDAYLDAYRHIDEFRGDAQLATWLTRIVINQALDAPAPAQARPRRRALRRSATAGDEPDPPEADVADETDRIAVSAVLRGEIRRLLERRIDELPSPSARSSSCATSRT